MSDNEYTSGDMASAAAPDGAQTVGPMDLTAPPKVWLQIDTDGDNEDRSEPVDERYWGDLTWCYESIGGQEVVYIRQDLATPQPPEDVEALRRDATRYRWIRDPDSDDPHGTIGMYAGEDLDTAIDAIIDAARAAKDTG